MRRNIALSAAAHGHLAGTRHAAAPLRHQIEELLHEHYEVVIDFGGFAITQSFADELIGRQILLKGPNILSRLIFKNCSAEVRAIIEFVATDRCDQYLKVNSH